MVCIRIAKAKTMLINNLYRSTFGRIPHAVTRARISWCPPAVDNVSAIPTTATAAHNTHLLKILNTFIRQLLTKLTL